MHAPPRIGNPPADRVRPSRWMPLATVLIVTSLWLPAEDRAKALPNLAVTNDTLAIHPFALEGLETIDMNALRSSGVQRFCEGFSLCAVEAPVELPSGSIVTRIELDVVDDSSANDVNANFYRCGIGSPTCEGIAGVSTSGVVGTVQIGTDLEQPEIIDNRDFTYLFEAAPGDDSETRIIGARVYYRAPESRPTSDVLAIHPHAHEARTSTGRAVLEAANIERFCNGADCVLSAPVELPSGAVVNRIELDAVGSSAEDVGLSLFRCEASTGACNPLASVSTNGNPGGTQVGSDLDTPQIIDNASATYVTEVDLGQSNATRLVGARILFDSPTAIPRHDRLAINPFAFEGRSANDIAAIEHTGGDRYCQGISCVLIAPVELSSGTRVTRLELSAVDSGVDDVRAVFSRCPVGAVACEDLAEVGTTGTPGSDQPAIDLSTIEIISNESFTYQIAVELGANSTTRLRAVSLVIENETIFADGFGPGDTTAWSSTVP